MPRGTARKPVKRSCEIPEIHIYIFDTFDMGNKKERRGV